MPQPSPSHICVQPHVASSPRRRTPCGARAPPHSPCRPTARNPTHSTTPPISTARGGEGLILIGSRWRDGFLEKSEDNLKTISQGGGGGGLRGAVNNSY